MGAVDFRRTLWFGKEIRLGSKLGVTKTYLGSLISFAESCLCLLSVGVFKLPKGAFVMNATAKLGRKKRDRDTKVVHSSIQGHFFHYIVAFTSEASFSQKLAFGLVVVKTCS